MSIVSISPKFISGNEKAKKSFEEFRNLISSKDELTSARETVSRSVLQSIKNPMVALRELDKAQSLVYPNNIIVMGKILATCAPAVVKWFAELYIKQIEESSRAMDVQDSVSDDSCGLQMASQIGWIMIMVNPDPTKLSPQFIAWRDTFIEASYVLDLEVIHEN